jgi:hypothetical protein
MYFSIEIHIPTHINIAAPVYLAIPGFMKMYMHWPNITEIYVPSVVIPAISRLDIKGIDTPLAPYAMPIPTLSRLQDTAISSTIDR